MIQRLRRSGSSVVFIVILSFLFSGCATIKENKGLVPVITGVGAFAIAKAAGEDDRAALKWGIGGAMVGTALAAWWEYVDKQHQQLEAEIENARREAEMANRRVGDLETRVQKLEERDAETNERVAKLEISMAGNAMFEFDSSRLTPEAMDTLDIVIRSLQEFDRSYIAIDGHTSADGSDSYNMQLSLLRADAVFDYVTSRGVSQNRIIRVKGWGETRLLPHLSSTDPQQRRVTLRLVDNPNRETSSY